jgi:hypothetical protein
VHPGGDSHSPDSPPARPPHPFPASLLPPGRIPLSPCPSGRDPLLNALIYGGRLAADRLGRRSFWFWKTPPLRSGLPHGHTLILEDVRLPAGNRVRVLAIISLVVVSVTIWLAFRIAYVHIYFGTLKNYTADLKFLRVLAEVNTVLLTTLTAMSSRAAIWAASSSRRGVSMSTWLEMSPATDMLGLTKLFWWRQQNGHESRDWHRLCCVIRLYLFRYETYLRILLHIAIPVIFVLFTSEIR